MNSASRRDLPGDSEDAVQDVSDAALDLDIGFTAAGDVRDRIADLYARKHEAD